MSSGDALGLQWGDVPFQCISGYRPSRMRDFLNYFPRSIHANAGWYFGLVTTTPFKFLQTHHSLIALPFHTTLSRHLQRRMIRPDIKTHKLPQNNWFS
jgi:hypothetical protein